MMTSAQVVETSVNVTSNSPSQDYIHLDDHNLPNYDMTPGFKPFTVSYFKCFCDSHQTTAVLYSAANDPETANDPRPQMIPRVDRK